VYGRPAAIIYTITKQLITSVSRDTPPLEQISEMDVSLQRGYAAGIKKIKQLHEVALSQIFICKTGIVALVISA
jgi:hypothetical protein